MNRLILSLAATAALSTAAFAAPAATPGVDLAGIDHATKPGDDFFRYANGKWIDITDIPADQASWGPGNVLAEEANKRVAGLITDAAAKAAPGSEARKIGDYYATYLDEAGIERQGLKPLAPTFARIAAIKSKRELAAEFGRELRADVDAENATNFRTDHLFGLWVEPDLNKPTQYAPYLLQGGLGLPDRDFYVSQSPRMQAIRTGYRAHLVRVLKLAGHADAEAQAGRIFDLETKIAGVHATRAVSEEVSTANNPWSRADFDKKAPGLDWAAFFGAAGLTARPQFIVWHPQATAGESALVASEPLSVWKEYLALRHIEHYAGLLPKAFVDERFAFFGKELSGTPQMAARQKRAVNATNGALGYAVGKLYAAKYFPPESKAAVQKMVGELIAAFRTRIQSLDWMAPATKAEALQKLAVLKVGVGYPDHWIDYSSLQIVRGDAVGNAMRAEAFEYRRNLNKFGKAVDRGEWVMTPQTVNAVNLPIRNALNFPAAILQPPYFNPNATLAENFGGTGATIGHEISHSFDDQGAQFDSHGRFRDWWTPADLSHFKASGRALAAQYSGYKPFPDLALNGEQVLSENIADLAGLNAAYDAYRLGSGGKEGAPLRGLTGDQQFFLSFGQSWRGKVREAALRQQVVTDGHAPEEFRADTVRNLDAWYPAFDVKPTEKLALSPDKRVRVW
ncbi:M13 family metallopeptidase [soil metagenome]